MPVKFFAFPIVIVLVLVSAAYPQTTAQETAALTNSDVVSMLKAGLSPELVVAKIKASKTNFDTSPAALAELKQGGVPENVLMAMVEAGAASASKPGSEQRNTQAEAAQAALKALRRLTSATDVGTSYVNYSPLVVEVKAEVEDALARMNDGDLKTSIRAAMNEYEYAAHVWQATWRNDFVEGDLKDVAVKNYGVQKKGWLKVVWRDDFLRAIWRQARNHFETANIILSSVSSASSADSAGTSNELVGAWKISLTGPSGQTVEIDMTVEKASGGYLATLRTPMGNLSTNRVIKQGGDFTVYASDHEKKRTVFLSLSGTIDAGTMKGTATLNDGKQSGSAPFTGSKYGSK
jgi:hypothetical protein